MLLLRGHQSPVRCLCFSADGELLASAAVHDPRIWLWEGQTGKALGRMVGHTQPVDCLALSPQGRLLASSAGFSELLVRDCRTWRLQLELRQQPAHVSRCLAFHPSGTEVSTGRARWDLRTGSLLPFRQVGHFSVWAAAYSPDGQTLALAEMDRPVQLYDLPGGTAQAALQVVGQVFRLCFSPDGRLLAASTGNGVHIWEAATGRITHRFTTHRAYVWALAFTPDRQSLGTAGTDGCVKLWDLASGRERVSFDWDLKRVHSIAFSPDGMRAAAGGDGDILVWDLDWY